jgi:hypothetical protein
LTNYTTPYQTRRLSTADTLKTGKKNTSQIGEFVRSENMSSVYACTSPMDSQDMDDYVEGKEVSIVGTHCHVMGISPYF